MEWEPLQVSGISKQSDVHFRRVTLTVVDRVEARTVRNIYVNMARHEDGLSENNNNGSKEK